MSSRPCWLLIERLLNRPLRGQPRINLLITAVGSACFWKPQPGAFWGESQVFPELVHETSLLEIGGAKISSVDLNSLSDGFALIRAGMAESRKTRPGRAMRAVAHSHEIAALVGVPVDKVISLTLWSVQPGSSRSRLYGVKYPSGQPFWACFPD